MTGILLSSWLLLVVLSLIGGVLFLEGMDLLEEEGSK